MTNAASPSPVSYDVCVVGGGPAGTVLASRLAQFGLRVLLVERSRFPRHHLGESLTPGVAPMLESVGAEWVLAASEARRVRAVQRKWGRDPSAARDAAGAIVDRARFDAHLLAHAQQQGVDVWQPASWLGHDVLRDGRAVVRVAHDGREQQVTVSVVAMATGRTSGGAKRRLLDADGPRTLALYAYWDGDVPSAPAIESLADGWCWGVPIPGLGYNALVFVDAGAVRSRDDREALYAAMLAQSVLVAPRHGSRRTPVQSADATPMIAEACIAPGVIAVGDAALALDPLSSSGVQKAIQNALAAAVVVNTLVTAPERSSDATAYYAQLIANGARRHATWAATFYADGAATSPPSAFWRARAGTASLNADVVHSFTTPEPPLVHPDQPLMPDPAVQITSCPCLGATVVTRTMALVHPQWDEPVAFVAGHAVAPVFADVRRGLSANDVVARSGLPQPAARAVVRWMIDRGVLAPLTGEPS